MMDLGKNCRTDHLHKLKSWSERSYEELERIACWLVRFQPAASSDTFLYTLQKPGHAGWPPIALAGTSLGNWLEPEGYMFGSREDRISAEIEGSSTSWSAPRHPLVLARLPRCVRAEDDIAFCATRGRTPSALPLHYKFFTPGNEEGLRCLIVWSVGRQYHLYVILDMHCAPGGQTGTKYRRQLELPMAL